MKTADYISNNMGFNNVNNLAIDSFRRNSYTGNLKNCKALSVGVLAFLGCCEYYNDRLLFGIENGEKWVYSNSRNYVPQTGYFDDMLKGSGLGANCASPVNWAFIDLGIIPPECRFWGGNKDGNFYFARFEKVCSYLSDACKLYNFNEGIKFAELYKSNKIKPGDIFLCNGHTFIYRGNESFYAAGHDGAWHHDITAPTEDAKKAVFDNWVLKFNETSQYGKISDDEFNLNFNYTIYCLIRIKDDYTPEYYRNRSGELVKFS